MKHRQSHRVLGRTANHRQNMMRTLTTDILRTGSLVTTISKAKELQKHLEPLITKAKQDLSLHVRRQLLSSLRNADDLARLREVAKRHQERPGGYTRLTRLVSNRHDNATMARLEIMAEAAAPVRQEQDQK